jgi:hypothetical protein
MTIFCVIVALVAIVAIMWVSGRGAANAANASQALSKARGAYQDSLERLKASPSNPDLRQLTLALGRQYSNLTRDKKGVTVYDEMAVMNDISAATAAASAPATPAPALASSIEDRLAKVNELHAKGIISDQELAQRRQKILDEV